ncbi:hypothetical protein CAEBREN_02732 [Caenorhabditis brenneri]|uniref:Transcription factor CBF/NF-Y/archaeal histone domain-containing protein n=1 Tax=Caenorhabditis brenneri TaxID=135651 RepID=G0PFL8_CAEBE|nr:hypothetical protein CAEBREN_02732 [Caenorhabditis brenneri]
MMSSGPLEPSDLPVFAAYPEPIIVPLDHVENEMKQTKNTMEVDETALYIMSKAVEEFIRQLTRDISCNGTKEMDYDSFAEYIQNSEFKSLREFFPERVRYGDIKHLLFPEQLQQQSPSSSQSSSSSSSSAPPPPQIH